MAERLKINLIIIFIALTAIRMVKQTNVGASFFDGETISAMNYVPIQAKQALELAKTYK
ncbi:hypothetical protein [Enterobacter sp. WCHEn045836]|uniref:hypothetical protein n=1 Tax=Enterobacter sp. WCHEn045836 TaxID=2497434 RepID=UPI00163AFADF|nr:hypothetical protein [Enterobacter sp. WCHEn045836]